MSPIPLEPRLAALDDARAAFRSPVEARRGRIVGTAGDSTLAAARRTRPAPTLQAVARMHGRRVATEFESLWSDA